MELLERGSVLAKQVFSQQVTGAGRPTTDSSNPAMSEMGTTLGSVF
jgi:hypothetical protein